MLQSINYLFAYLTAPVAPRSEKGATATEYALIVAGIAVVIVGAIAAFGGSLTSFFSGLGGRLSL